MEQLKCTECGQVFGRRMDACPNCGCPASECETIATAETVNATAETVNATSETVNATSNSYSPSAPQKPYVFEVDWADRFYQCSVLYWKVFTFRTIRNKRASRLEFWSYYFFSTFVPFLIAFVIASAGSSKESTEISLGFFNAMYIVHLPPFIAVLVRRLHDIGRSAWWWLLPIVPLFMCFKKSDEGENKYGMPSDIKLQ